MDSLTQITLGAAVCVATMGRRTAPWKAALWGGMAGTLPDLDVFIDHGDPILNMVLHRAETHAPFWLTLFSLPFAALVARLQGEWGHWRRWWLALWLVLVTHALLDAMTVYGTQLALPWTDRPYGMGSIFIIDPLYTLPLLAGVLAVLLTRGSRRGHALNTAGLLLSCTYLAWSVAAQQQVERIARAALVEQGIEARRLLVTPTAFNTVLWRIVAMGSTGDYHEGYRSLLDDGSGITFRRFDGGAALAPELLDIDGVRRIAAFSGGFYKLSEQTGRLRVTDLRMGYEPYYTFNFVVAERRSALRVLPASLHEGERGDVRELLAWTWGRLQGEPLAAPFLTPTQ
ncbi:MAG: metal-dependent hydrolase [Burkholderiaceae bacterium]|jgi:inner membrane protein|nr:metal-dependent hydrolase [Burkholderiaceae bacterium]MEB2320100.1 metal-dependent hydrolase [Pseudomonadota bacterium]